MVVEKLIFGCWRVMYSFVGIVLAGDTGSRTSLPGGDDDSLGDDGTSSSRYRANAVAMFLI